MRRQISHPSGCDDYWDSNLDKDKHGRSNASFTKILTSLWGPHCDHLIGFVQLAEALGENFDLVGGVWFQHCQLVGGLVAVSVHNSPLLGAHKPKQQKISETCRILFPRIKMLIYL